MLPSAGTDCVRHARAPIARTLRSVRALRHMTSSATLPSQVQLRAAQLPKLILSPGSAHHDSLPSFLEYAARTKLAPSRTVYVGTHYEYTVALALLRLGFSLLRTGRRADAGIDLIGHWILPPLPEPLRVIVQCKARSDTCAPKEIRELEGAFQARPPDWRRKSVLGLLVTTQKATKGVLDALQRNAWPMGFLKITRTGEVEQFIWNQAAGDRGLEGVGVTIRHTPRLLDLHLDVAEQGQEGSAWKAPSKRRWRKRFADLGTQKDVQLTWLGHPIFADRERLDEETLRLKRHMEYEPSSRPKPNTKTAQTTASTVVTVKRRGRPPGSKDKAPRKRSTKPQIDTVPATT